MRSALLALPALLCLSFPAAAQSPSAKPPAEQQAPPQAAPSPSASAPAPRRDDVKSIDSILAALYGVISGPAGERSEEHTSELQSQSNLVCRLLLEKKKQTQM